MTGLRTIEMVVTAETFIRDTPPMAEIRGICEHGHHWVKRYYTDEIGTDWNALDALKEISLPPSCEYHQ